MCKASQANTLDPAGETQLPWAEINFVVRVVVWSQKGIGAGLLGVAQGPRRGFSGVPLGLCPGLRGGFVRGCVGTPLGSLSGLLSGAS